MPTINTEGTSADVPVPTVFNDFQADDLLLCVIYVQWYANFDTSSAITPPVGWTELEQVDMPYAAASEGDRFAVFYRVSNGTEPASYEFTWGQNALSVARIAVFRNVNPATPFIDSGIALSVAADPIEATTPSVNTTADDQRIVCAWGARGLARTWSVDNGAMTLLSQPEKTTDTTYDPEFVTDVTYDRVQTTVGPAGTLCMAHEQITSALLLSRLASITPDMTGDDRYGAAFICILNPNPAPP